jgi:hypothetical protein
MLLWASRESDPELMKPMKWQSLEAITLVERVDPILLLNRPPRNQGG